MEKDNQNDDFDVNFVMCYKKFYTRIKHYINKKFISDEFLVEDITHNVFLKVYEKRNNLKIDSPGIIKYFYVMARNMVFDHINRKIRENKKMTEIRLETVRMNKDFYRDVEDFYIEGEVLLTIQDIIDSFSEEEKDVYVKKTFDKLNGLEVIERTDVTRYMQKRIEQKVNERIVKKLRSFDKVRYDESSDFEYKYSGLLCEPKGVYK